MQRTRERIKRILISTTIVFAIVSCVTINIYFPAAAVEKVADEIVDEVWGNDNDDGVPVPESSLKSGSFSSWISFGPRSANAADEGADINVTTPAIRALKGAIHDRASSIKPFLESGNVGISNDGLLVSRSVEGLNMKDKAKLKRLLAAENKDRNSLYSEIAKANDFAPDRVEDIKKLFAKSWIKNAKAGWWIQGPDGKWAQK